VQNSCNDFLTPPCFFFLQERLQSHAKAFESLLALTPAQEYYGSQIVDGRDPNDQWKAKKQTKEEKHAAKKAKLDPANQKSALDIMKERELKRKRELGMDDGEVEMVDADEKPDGGKRQKVEETADEAEARRRLKAEKRKDKREKKKEKAAKLKEKRDAKKAAKQDGDDGAAKEKSKAEKTSKNAPTEDDDEDEDDEDEDDDDEPTELAGASDMDKVDMSGLVDSEDGASTAPSSPALDSPAFDLSANHSTASSSSSIVPPSDQSTSAPSKKSQSSVKQQPLPPALDTAATTKPRPTTSGTASPRLNLPNIDSEALQDRLRSRIEELRNKRKADGPDGKNPKSRQELLDQRRKKEEQRKAHKKELRRLAKEEEDRKQEERLRGSGSPLNVDIFSPRETPKEEHNSFSFSRLAFDDGTAPDASLSHLVEAKKRKGPQDVKSALAAAEAKQKRLAGLDPEKRADIAEKDLWLNAKKRAHGERIRDDTSLLKKALKRKEKGKSKSEKEWKDREDAVVKGKQMKDKKREANLKARAEGKGQKGKGKKGKSGGKPGGAKKGGRPGFEGKGFKA